MWFLYYDRAIEPTIWMVQKSLAAVQTNQKYKQQKKPHNYEIIAYHIQTNQQNIEEAEWSTIYIQMHPTSSNQRHVAEQVDIFPWPKI